MFVHIFSICFAEIVGMDNHFKNYCHLERVSCNFSFGYSYQVGPEKITVVILKGLTLLLHF